MQGARKPGWLSHDRGARGEWKAGACEIHVVAAGLRTHKGLACMPCGTRRGVSCGELGIRLVLVCVPGHLMGKRSTKPDSEQLPILVI